MKRSKETITKTIKINPLEFKIIYARFHSGRIVRYTMDVLNDLKTEPGVDEIYNADGVSIYKKEV